MKQYTKHIIFALITLVTFGQPEVKAFSPVAQEWGKIACSAAQIPSILAAGSETPEIIATTSIVACLASAARGLSELAGPKAIPAFSILYTQPKVFLLILAAVHDAIKTLDASYEARKNEQFANEAKVFHNKVNKMVMVTIALFLRALCLVIHSDSGIRKTCSYLLSQAADWIEIYCLISRYWTNFLKESDIQKIEENLEAAAEDAANKASGDHGPLEKSQYDDESLVMRELRLFANIEPVSAH